MPSYDASRFDPPAPVARVTRRNPSTGATISDVLLLLDTGADVTLLPRTAVEQLGVSVLAGQRYELVGFDGSRSFAPVVMVLARCGFSEVEQAHRPDSFGSRYVPFNNTEALIRLTWDGKEQWFVLQSIPVDVHNHLATMWRAAAP